MNKKIRLLQIDANPDDSRTIKELLLTSNETQFDLIHCETLAAACETLKTNVVDVILLELSLPDSQGFKTFNTLYQKYRNIPIIILTTVKDQLEALSSVHAGAHDYFIKGLVDGVMLSQAIAHSIAVAINKSKLIEYNHIMDSIEEAIYTENLEGIIQSWSLPAEAIYGYSADEIIGKNFMILIPEQLKIDVSRIFEAIKEGASVSRIKTKRIRKDKKIIDILMKEYPIKDCSEKIIGVSIIAEDITQKVFAEKQLIIQYKIAKILNESNDIHLAAQNILKTACEILKWHRGEFWLVDESSNQLKHESTWLHKSYATIVDSASNQSDIFLSKELLEHVKKTKESYWIHDLSTDTAFDHAKLMEKNNLKSLIALPLVYESTVLAIFVFYSSDIQEPELDLLTILKSICDQIAIFMRRMKVEQEQKYLQESLTIKNIELEEQAAFLRQANQAKANFLANMSHELRTPLNSVIGFTDLMYSGKVGPVSAEHKDLLGEVATSGRHLLHLINDILDLSKIEAGKMQCHSDVVNLEKLVNELSNSMRLFMNEKQIKFEFNIHPSLKEDVLLDADKFKQILYNYLSNAIKFTSSGGKIEVKLLPENDKFFRVEVGDTGIGISKSDMEKLFVMFGQLDISYSKPYQGIGLGLALSRHIAEVMGGQVGVNSELGKGSTFYVILPWIHPIPSEERSRS